ncbi:MAG: class I SAM-dependent methyltransferase [Dehalococcoidia bacterium]
MTHELATRPADKLGPDDLQAYWGRVSADYLARDPEGLAVICYAGLPRWFNAFLDRYQRRAFDRLTARLRFAGADVLDLGTGVGRWATVLAQRGAARVVGVDLEGERLALARARSSWAVDYLRMGVDGLAFPSQSFDVVNSVTVLQHVDRNVKSLAIAEAARVLRPGGHLILFERADLADHAPHVFPESRAAWLDLCGRHGLRLVREEGDQYTPLLRLAKRVMRGSSGRTRIDELKRRESGPAMLALRALVLLSYPLEELCQRLLPARAAMISGYLLEKPGPATGAA